MKNRRKEKEITTTLRPFQYSCQPMRTCIIEILVLLLPQVFMLFFTKSFFSIFLIASSVAASILSEILVSRMRNRQSVLLDYLVSTLQGLLIGFLLPESYQIFGAFLIVFTTLTLLKYSYGSFSDNWINPIALTVAVAYLLGQSRFPQYLMTSELLQQKNPSLALISEGIISVTNADLKITGFLNSTIFKLLNISIPEGYVSIFWDTHSPIPAFRFNFLTLISSIVLFATGTIPSLIPGIFVATYSLCVLLFSPLLFGGSFLQGDIILALFTSGFFFSSLFVLQWYGTAPLSTWGKIVYAVFTGVACFLIIGAGTSPIGMMFTILIANIFSTFIQYFEDIGCSNHIRKILIPRITEMKSEQ